MISSYYKNKLRQGVASLTAFLTATLGKGLLNLLLKTCHWEVTGASSLHLIAGKENCLLALWHNRIIIAPFFFHRFVPDRIFAGFISNSRDGKLIDFLVRSYSKGRTIRVAHDAKYAGLKRVINCIEKDKWVVVMTPDGPRGPKYALKPGLVAAAVASQSNLFVLNWTADRFWELKTWDGLRIPKPFAKITVAVDSFPKLDPELPFLKTDAQAFFEKTLLK